MSNKRSPSVGRRAVAGSSATGRATVSSQLSRPIGAPRRPLALAIRAALLAAPMAVALSGPAGAQPGFDSKTIATNADNAFSVFAADMDGDGDTDVLSASRDDNKIAWYENDGSQNFTLRTITTNADNAVSVFAADVDGDGDTDVLSASFIGNKIAWYENDGSQNFTPRTITTNASGPYSVFAADVDGDGDTDVLSASALDDEIAWYENDGSQNFTPLHDRDQCRYRQFRIRCRYRRRR